MMEIAIAERARAATKTVETEFTAETQNTQRFFIQTLPLCPQCLSGEISGNLHRPRQIF